VISPRLPGDVREGESLCETILQTPGDGSFRMRFHLWRTHMPLGTLSVRIDDANPLHHLWNNNGTWWVHYTLNFDFRTRRRRYSLGTHSLEEAVRRRDELFARLQQDGEPVAERSRRHPDDAAAHPGRAAPARLAHADVGAAERVA
jgi:hypothetical protein